MPLSALSKIGIAKETAWGDGATTFTNIPIEPFSYSPITYELLRDQSLRGEFAADFGIYQGVYRVELSLEGHVRPDEIGYLIYALFGAVSTTSTDSHYQHTFTMSATPPSLAVLDQNGVQTVMLRGLRVGEFSFSFNAAEDFFDWSADLTGKDYTTSTLTVGDATDEAPFIGWQATADIGGVAYAKIITFEATLTRELSVVYTANNTQAPYAIYAGPLEASGSMTVLFDDVTDLNRYLNNTTASMEITLASGDHSFKLTSANVSFASEPAEISRDEVDLRLTLNWRALQNATDNGPCRIILVNNTTSY